MPAFANAEDVMRRALELANRGIGLVEPNPPVGAVLIDDGLNFLGEGWHERFGGPHAEVVAISQAGAAARGSTLYVTLEPCCHQGKTPPCTDAIIAAGVKKCTVAMQDPFPQVAGGGIERLRAAGIEVEVGLLGAEARRLAAPFCKLVETALPYVHAKWAITLDGRIASRTGASKWISNRASRDIVHRLRGRMDAVIVGIGTVLADDPLLTARPAGLRVAARVVFDSQARLRSDSQLVRTVDQAPVIVAAVVGAPAERIERLRASRVEVFECSAVPAPGALRPDPVALLAELGRRRMTNVLVEGGGELLGSFFDRHLVDEVHVFVAPKLLGGQSAKSALAGTGREAPSELPDIERPEIELLDGDVYIHGPLARRSSPQPQVGKRHEK